MSELVEKVAFGLMDQWHRHVSMDIARSAIAVIARIIGEEAAKVADEVALTADGRERTRDLKMIAAAIRAKFVGVENEIPQEAGCGRGVEIECRSNTNMDRRCCL